MEKSKTNLLSNYQKVFRLVWELHPPVIIYSFLYALAVTIIPYLDFWFLGSVVNDLTRSSEENQLLIKAIGFVSATYVLTIMRHFFQKKRNDAEHQLELTLDEQTSKRLLTMPYATLENPKIREDYQRAKEGTNYNGGLHTFINETLKSIFQLIVAIVISGSALISLYLAKGAERSGLTWINSPWFLVTILIVLLTPVLASFILFKKENLIRFEQFDKIVEINRLFTYYYDTVANYKNGMTFRLYQSSEMFLKRIVKSNDDSRKFFIEMNRKTFRYTGSVLLISGCVTALLYVLIGLKAYIGAVAIGSVLLYAGYLQQLLMILLEFFKSISVGNTIVEYIQYYYDFIFGEGEALSGTLPIEKRDDNDYQIEFHGVGFKYPRTTEWVLKDFSIKLTIGERLSVVGRNGSGKSTFIALLCRLYEPTEGYITLNGIAITKYNPREYQQILGVVFQDFKLFSFSVAENVATSLTPNRQRVEKALEIAGVRERIQEMPKDIDTILTKHLNENGVEISGGESQKIAIARAWYKDAPLIILDEPTSALDPVAEYDIYKHFDDLIETKSAIYISHRMSSARFSQRIVVFDQGNVVQEGTHERLMEISGGLYYQLFTAQAQYYTVDKESDEKLQQLFSY